MMGRQMAQGALFCGFRLDEHVPADHLLRRINGLLDFGFVREAMAASYSVSGRPSIDPELMLTRETATQREEFLAARRPPPAARRDLADAIADRDPIGAAAIMERHFDKSIGDFFASGVSFDGPDQQSDAAPG